MPLVQLPLTSPLYCMRQMAWTSTGKLYPQSAMSNLLRPKNPRTNPQPAISAAGYTIYTLYYTILCYIIFLLCYILFCLTILYYITLYYTTLYWLYYIAYNVTYCIVYTHLLPVVAGLCQLCHCLYFIKKTVCCGTQLTRLRLSRTLNQWYPALARNDLSANAMWYTRISTW